MIKGKGIATIVCGVIWLVAATTEVAIAGDITVGNVVITVDVEHRKAPETVTELYDMIEEENPNLFHFCKAKKQLVLQTYKERNDFTADEFIDKVTAGTKTRLPHHMLVDLERVIRDTLRPGKNGKFAKSEEIIVKYADSAQLECIVYGF